MTYHLKVEPVGVAIKCNEDETLLEALTREEVKVKNSMLCKSGRCGMCKCFVSFGEVDHGNVGTYVLTEEEREEGYTLLCTATPLSNVEIKMEKSIF